LGGDNQAFKQIVEKTEGLVAQIIFKMTTDNEDKKDIAQEVYIKAYRNLAGFRFRSKLSTWVGQIAFNTCVNHLQKKKTVLPGPVEALGAAASEDPDTGHGIETREMAAILQREIERLSPLYKTLITLYHNEDQSYADIAQITGLPEGTVKSYLFRARKMLKDNLLLKYKKEQL
jgi:RNA polymerase sigma-70 factor (ECF subfamily)